MVLIGAGKLGTKVGPAFERAGISVLQVVNRSEKSGDRLAKKLGAEFVNSPDHVRPDADLYLMTVSDLAIEPVSDLIPLVKGIVCHTSGATPLSILRHHKTGVIWPVCSFSGKRRPDFRKIPFLIEGNSPEVLYQLKDLGARLSNRVVEAGSEQRLKIHLAAVFASNFSNYMAAVAAGLMTQACGGPELLDELLHTTCRSMADHDPFSYQTGPALRGDVAVMEAHLHLLEHDPELQAIYRQLSAGILNMKRKE